MPEENASKEVTLGAQDVENVEVFFKHYGIEIPQYLQEQIDLFKSVEKYTIDMQEGFRNQLARALVSVKNPIMEDELFKGVISKCDKVWFDAQFDSDVEEVLSEDNN